MSFTDRQLQHELDRHPLDFGNFGTNSPGSRLDYLSSLVDHIDSPATTRIEGKFRDDAAVHYLDPQTGLNVVTNLYSGFRAEYRLTAAQIKRVVATGELGLT
jgi:Colicin D